MFVGPSTRRSPQWIRFDVRRDVLLKIATTRHYNIGEQPTGLRARRRSRLLHNSNASSGVRERVREVPAGMAQAGGGTR